MNLSEYLLNGNLWLKKNGKSKKVTEKKELQEGKKRQNVEKKARHKDRVTEGQ